MEEEKIYFKVKVLEEPENEDIMYCLEIEKKFPTFEMALKCAKIWKEHFNLCSKIQRVSISKCEVK